MKMLPLAVFAVALAACSQQPANDNAVASVTNNAADTGYIARVKALPDGQLRGVLLRAITDGGETCQGVQDLSREPDREGQPVWSVRCTEGSTWVITMADDGVAKVTGASVTRPSAAN